MAKVFSQQRRFWLPSFYGRFTFLLFLLSLLVLYFYVVGNAQGFADRTLVFLFTVESWTLAVCALSGMFSTVSYAVMIPVRKRIQLGRILLSAGASLFSVLLYLLVAIIEAFMDSYG